jgi:ribosomal protein S25
VNDFLDQKRREITERLRELKPAVEEHNRLQAAAAALAKVRPASSAAATPARRGPGRPRGSGTRVKAVKAVKATRATATKARKKPGRPPGTGRRRAGRRKGSGTRAAQALAFVQGQPGITIPELAAKMGIKQNYLYRVLPGLESEGKVAKQGRGWHPKR